MTKRKVKIVSKISVNAQRGSYKHVVCACVLILANANFVTCVLVFTSRSVFVNTGYRFPFVKTRSRHPLE